MKVNYWYKTTSLVVYYPLDIIPSVNPRKRSTWQPAKKLLALDKKDYNGTKYIHSWSEQSVRG